MTDDEPERERAPAVDAERILWTRVSDKLRNVAAGSNLRGRLMMHAESRARSAFLEAIAAGRPDDEVIEICILTAWDVFNVAASSA
jgi:hypothetical protein